ncbi:hypothetical protein KCU91_g122, partial [Aureobasidium melanogenum]
LRSLWPGYKTANAEVVKSEAVAIENLVGRDRDRQTPIRKVVMTSWDAVLLISRSSPRGLIQVSLIPSLSDRHRRASSPIAKQDEAVHHNLVATALWRQYDAWKASIDLLSSTSSQNRMNRKRECQATSSARRNPTFITCRIKCFDQFYLEDRRYLFTRPCHTRSCKASCIFHSRQLGHFMQHDHLGLCDSISHATSKHKSHGLVIGFIDFPSPVSDAGEKDLLTPRYGRSCLSHAELYRTKKVEDLTKTRQDEVVRDDMEDNTIYVRLIRS